MVVLLLVTAAILVVALIGALLQRVAQRRRPSRRHFVTAAASAGRARVRTLRSSRPCLGHSTLEMTLNVNSHRVEEADRRLAESFDKLVRNTG